MKTTIILTYDLPRSNDVKSSTTHDTDYGTLLSMFTVSEFIEMAFKTHANHGPSAAHY